MIMDYNELARRCHENAVKHGFWENNPSDEHCLMLVITEIAEMVEADRKGKYSPKEDMMKGGFDKDVFEKYYKNTVEDEMADIAIRLLYLIGSHDESAFEKYKVNSKDIRFVLKNIPENAYYFCRRLTFFQSPSICSFVENLMYLFIWAEALGIDLERHIMMKIEYNESRSVLHGKKY